MEDIRWLQFLYSEDIYLTADMKQNTATIVTKEEPKDPLIPVTLKEEKNTSQEPTITIPKIDRVEPSRIRVLVLPGSSVLNADDQSLFNNIFYNPKALALKEQEVKLIEVSDFDKWKADFIVSFGVAIPGHKGELYMPHKGTTNILQADSLSAIGKNVELKKELWKSLQILFGK